MFSIVPDLTPRDSHSLWYVSSRSPLPPLSDGANLDGANAAAISQHQNPQHRRNNHGGAANALEQSALYRLREDEINHEKRHVNAANFGAPWLKPPGIPKTLFQMREERREQEEHAEAMRREQMAQQLAEAEGNAALADLDMMDEGEGDAAAGEGERDLDDEIPDADADGFGFDAGLSDDDEDEDDDDDEDDDEDQDHERSEAHAGGGPEGTPGGPDAAQRRELRQIGATEDRVLGLMTRGQAQQQHDEDLYGAEDDAEDVGVEGHSALLQEDDLVHGGGAGPVGGERETSFLHESVSVMDMDMDADLDDEVPEAESGEYEHTDSSASLSSSEEDEDDGDQHQHAQPSFAMSRPSVSQQFMPSSNPLSFDNPQGSLDISSVLSGDGSSSVPGSSPQIRRLQ